MNKLSKEKKDKLILIILGTLGVVGILYTFVLGAQQDKLSVLETQITSTSDKLSKAERMVRSADRIEENLAESRQAIDLRQKDMAPQGQYFYWFLKMLDQFRKEQGLETNFIVDITQPEFAEAGLLPEFPYKAAIFGVRANGYYKDIGRFFAALENAFPYIRIQNVKIQPEMVSRPPGGLVTGGQENAERLAVEFKVVTLVKPGTT